ncbi:hypothetical membrane protein [Corynebacterium renale]|uniref:Tellurite resistance protein TehA-like permease n=1 Tax=Corynebacterium renale TaxID=1724 RepID=A0A2A9DRN1_9CORY|nr:tellurite resistance protein TehA-like permease [Corynebacterium renale]SQI25697.1 hypothetical membrane protein [Corynebacterium renale]
MHVTTAQHNSPHPKPAERASTSKSPKSKHSLPPAGPAWGGSLMGTSIVATLVHHDGFPQAAVFFAVLATGILGVICAGLVYHRPQLLRAEMPSWAMFFIGIIALGSAWTTITENPEWSFLGFWIGTPLCIIVYVIQLGSFTGNPAFTWGLPLVGPMIAATTAGNLVPFYGEVYQLFGRVLFLMSFVTAIPVFTYVYVSLWRGKVDISGPLAATTWIPLGVVGQSTSAVNVLLPDAVEVVYGSIMLSIGVPLALFAMSRFYSAVLRWVDYAPAWWASTFPTGTISLGSYHLSMASGQSWLEVISYIVPVLLLFHWCLCVARFVSWCASGLKRKDMHPTA